MFAVPKKAVTSWGKYQSYTNVFVPQSIDIGCPHCKRTPVNFPFLSWEMRADSLYTASRCPACGAQSKFWILDYHGESADQAAANSKIYMMPMPPLHVPFDDRVKDFSPSFVEIYNQAAFAEMLGLDKLIGVGYRKSLEFLIKDWLSHQHPDKVAEIQDMFLGKCIQQFVDDQRVKDCAERAVWLGNDETHYVRKWDDKDISDMKTLLTLTIYWISSSLISEEYIAGMPKK